MLERAVKLTAHYWQNWKRVFLSCYFHEIYRVEAVGLKRLFVKVTLYSFECLFGRGSLCYGGLQAMINQWRYADEGFENLQGLARFTFVYKKTS